MSEQPLYELVQSVPSFFEPNHNYIELLALVSRVERLQSQRFVLVLRDWIKLNSTWLAKGKFTFHHPIPLPVATSTVRSRIARRGHRPQTAAQRATEVHYLRQLFDYDQGRESNRFKQSLIQSLNTVHWHPDQTDGVFHHCFDLPAPEVERWLARHTSTEQSDRLRRNTRSVHLTTMRRL